MSTTGKLVERLRVGAPPKENPDHEIVWVQNLRAHFKDGMFSRQVFPEWNDIFLEQVNALLDAAAEAADAIKAKDARIAELEAEVQWWQSRCAERKDQLLSIQYGPGAASARGRE